MSGITLDSPLPFPRPDEVHVWTLELCRDRLPALSALLSEQEREAGARYAREVDREMFTWGHGARRLLLGRYLETPPSAIAFESGEFGKPFLPSTGNGPDLRFNVSHSGGVALLAVAQAREVGVDVERMTALDDLEGVAARAFSTHEREAVFSQPPALRREWFFAAWARKEAVIKALGRGLSFPLEHFDVETNPHAVPRLLVSRHPMLDLARWRMCPLRTPVGYQAALAVEVTPAVEAFDVTVRQVCWP